MLNTEYQKPAAHALKDPQVIRCQSSLQGLIGISSTTVHVPTHDDRVRNSIAPRLVTDVNVFGQITLFFGSSQPIIARGLAAACKNGIRKRIARHQTACRVR
jgi:hypothetical protein